jgi:hypothetical protein
MDRTNHLPGLSPDEQRLQIAPLAWFNHGFSPLKGEKAVLGELV